MFGIKSWVPPNQQVDASHKLTVNEILRGMGHGRRYRPVLKTSLGEGRSILLFCSELNPGALELMHELGAFRATTVRVGGPRLDLAWVACINAIRST